MRYGSAATARRAQRALFEGAPVSLGLLAQACRLSETHLATLARREGWRKADEAPQEDTEALERRLVVLSDQLVSDLEAAGAEGRAAGAYDKHRIDALSTMLRMVEKLGEMTRLPERAAEKQKKSDAELAAALSLIDARIVELACELAATMGGEDAERGSGATNPV